jgi:hypothetical protein
MANVSAATSAPAPRMLRFGKEPIDSTALPIIRLSSRKVVDK